VRRTPAVAAWTREKRARRDASAADADEVSDWGAMDA
jgi:hypothetical protein